MHFVPIDGLKTYFQGAFPFWGGAGGIIFLQGRGLLMEDSPLNRGGDLLAPSPCPPITPQFRCFETGWGYTLADLLTKNPHNQAVKSELLHVRRGARNPMAMIDFAMRWKQ